MLRVASGLWIKVRNYFDVYKPLFHGTVGPKVPLILQHGLKSNVRGPRGTVAQVGISTSRNLDFVLEGHFGNYVLVLDEQELSRRFRLRSIQYSQWPDKYETRIMARRVPPLHVHGLIINRTLPRSEKRELSGLEIPVVHRVKSKWLLLPPPERSAKAFKPLLVLTPYDKWLTKHRPWIPHLPKVEQAFDKFGPKVGTYMDALTKWLVEGKVSQEAALELKKYLPILKFLSPRPATPPLLWRGLHAPKALPQPGQKVKYSAKRPATSWASTQLGGEVYCGRNGIVLAVKGTMLLKSGDLFLWPLRGDLKKLYGPDADEWGIYLKKVVPIVKWALCR